MFYLFLKTQHAFNLNIFCFNCAYFIEFKYLQRSDTDKKMFPCFSTMHEYYSNPPRQPFRQELLSWKATSLLKVLRAYYNNLTCICTYVSAGYRATESRVLLPSYRFCIESTFKAPAQKIQRLSYTLDPDKPQPTPAHPHAISSKSSSIFFSQDGLSPEKWILPKKNWIYRECNKSFL